MFGLKGGTYTEGESFESEDAIQLYQEDGWKTVGHMSEPRGDHAVSVVSFDDICQTTTTTSPTPTPSSSPSINFCYQILVLCFMFLRFR